jgi:hypothetical protein
MKTPDGFAGRIGQQRNLDATSFRKLGQDLLGIIGYGGNVESLGFEVGFRCAQLDELAFAAPSPVGGLEEKEDESLRADQIVESAILAILIDRVKIRNVFPDLQGFRPDRPLRCRSENQNDRGNP